MNMNQLIAIAAATVPGLIAIVGGGSGCPPGT